MSVADKVIEIVTEELSVPKDEVKLDKSFMNDFKADSLDIVELVMRFEDEFKITIPEEDQEKIKTVGDAINYIEQRQKASA